MATQHPDNACAPYWETDGDGFVSTGEEVEECYSAFKDLGCDEYMWDWEGKYVEEAVIERLFQEHLNYFKASPLGKAKFLTFRIPNLWQEKSHGLARAMMCILTAEDTARNLGLYAPPLFEVILPMTKKASEIIHIQKLFFKLSNFTSKLFNYHSSLPKLEVMPLFEGIDDLLNCKKLLINYAKLYKNFFGKKLIYIRPHIARSDPALNSGLVAAVVAGKIALSEFYQFSRQTGIKVYPEVGVGTLPFRGSLSPERLSDFFRQYNGIKTVYIQSAFRYDFVLNKVKKAIRELNHTLPKLKPTIFSAKEINEAKIVCNVFAKEYRETVEKLAPLIYKLAVQVPRRRERKLHVGLFGYSRGVGKKRLPRAIPFTAVLYSLGVPPEFIGMGTALQKIISQKISLTKYYPTLLADLSWAARFVNKDNLEKLAKLNNCWQKVKRDILLTEKLLKIKLGPITVNEKKHQKITGKVLMAWRNKQSISNLILQSGKLRKSLG